MFKLKAEGNIFFKQLCLTLQFHSHYDVGRSVWRAFMYWGIIILEANHIVL